MKTIILFFILVLSTSAQTIISPTYLVNGDSIETFTSQYRNLEITVVDSTVADTLVLEKQSLKTTDWANISVLSNKTGAIVVSMIPGTGVGGAIYYLENFGEGNFRLRMTDGGDLVARRLRVKVVGRY